jgi:hypothetical protein
VRLGSHVTLHAVHVPCSCFVAQKRRRCQRFCNSAVRFVTAEETVAPWDGACFDISVKIDDLNSDDDDDDDDDD